MCVWGGGGSETSSTRGYGDFADSEIGVCLEVIFKIGTAVIMVFVCMCVCLQVHQHVNRTAYFSLLSPPAFLFHSSYIVFHPASFPSFLSASLSLQALRTFTPCFFTVIFLCIFSSLSLAVLSCFQAVLSHSLCFFSPTFHVSSSLSHRLMRNGRICKTEVLECCSSS